jgi:cobalt/nickel transport system permease protein
MHIPDGYISPATSIISYVIAVPLWKKSLSHLRKELNEEALPLLGTVTAFSFLIMMFNIPIPGGTSGHAIGTALLTRIFGPWIAAFSVSLVLFFQAILFGDGGLTTWALNSLAMGYVAAFSAHLIFVWIKKQKWSAFIGGWFSIVMASILVAFVLGLQPILFVKAGKPLYVPFCQDQFVINFYSLSLSYTF